MTALVEARDQELAATVERGERAAEDLEAATEQAARRDEHVAELEGELVRLEAMRGRVLRELHDREQQVRQLRMLLRAEPPEGDDLTQIKGIGPVIAELLNDVGIYTYAQIVAWDEADLEWIREREPRLRGRIRKAWAKSAQKAHEQKVKATN